MALHGGDLLLESHDLRLLVGTLALRRILGVLDLGSEAVVLRNRGDALLVFCLDDFFEATHLQVAIVLGEFLTSEVESTRVAGNLHKWAVVTQMLAAFVIREEIFAA